MVEQTNGRSYPCVVIDLNTQRDLCLTDGARPVTNAADIVPALRRVVAWTKRNGAPLISSVDSHRTGEMPRSGCPAHCVDGTIGQQKVEFTVFRSQTTVQVDNTLSVPLDLFSHCQQVIFRQRGEDLLANPKADRFVTQLPAREFVLFGNDVEGAVKNVALGLIAREKRLTVVRDACGYWDRNAADLAFRLFEAKGVSVITVDELAMRKLERPRRVEVCIKAIEAGRRNGRKASPAARRNGTTNGRSSHKNRTENGELRARPTNGTIPRSRGKQRGT